MLTESNIRPSSHGGLQGACRLASFEAFSQMGSFCYFPPRVWAVLRVSLLFLLHPSLPASAAVSHCLSNSPSPGSYWGILSPFVIATGDKSQGEHSLGNCAQ